MNHELANPRSLFQRPVRAGSPEARLISGLLEHLVDLATDLPEGAAKGAGLACVDLVHVCLGSTHRRRPRKAKRPRNDAARIERFIQRNVALEALGAELLCDEFKLSRPTLYRLLQPRGGVAEIIRRHRTARAHRLLTTRPGLPIDAVRQRSGFSDDRTFRRALRDIYDATPGQLRRGTRGERDEALPPQDETSAWIDAEHVAPDGPHEEMPDQDLGHDGEGLPLGPHRDSREAVSDDPAVQPTPSPPLRRRRGRPLKVRPDEPPAMS